MKITVVLGVMLFASCQAKSVTTEGRIAYIRQLIEKMEQKEARDDDVKKNVDVKTNDIVKRKPTFNLFRRDEEVEAECVLANPLDVSPVVSPGYHGAGLPPMHKCMFEIGVEAGKHIKITFDEVEMEDACDKGGKPVGFGLFVLDDNLPLNAFPAIPSKGMGFCKDPVDDLIIKSSVATLYIKTGIVTPGANKFKVSYEAVDP